MASDFHELADAYLHGLLTPKETKAFERRLQSEPNLRSALETARRRLSLVTAALPPAESSETLVQATLSRIDRWSSQRAVRRRRLALVFWVPLAAAILILGVFHYHFATLSASPVSLEVYGQDEWLPGSETAIHVRLVDRSNRRPLSGVPVEVGIRRMGESEFTHLAEVATDAEGHGAASFQLPNWPDGSYELRVQARPAGESEKLTRPVRLRRSVRIMASSDKPRYQPGQTIHLRALALRNLDSKPAAGQTAHLAVRDSRGRNIVQTTQELNRFGLAAADVPLPKDVPLGSYHVACTVGDTSSGFNVMLERYTLPKAMVTLTTDKPWYRQEEEIVVTMEASTFDGKPVAGTAATLEVQLIPNATVLSRQTAKTDAVGKAIFRYRIPKSFLLSRSLEHLAIRARIGDAASPMGASTIATPVADKPVIVQTSIPEGNFAPGTRRQAAISLRTPDGHPVAAMGEILADDRSYPFQTDEAGNAEVEFATPRNVSTVQVSVKAPDGSQVVQVFPVAMSIQPVQVLLQTDRRTYRTGDTMHVIVHSLDGQAYVDFRRDRQTLKTTAVEIRAGRGEFDFVWSPDMRGEWTIIAHRLHERLEAIAEAKVAVEPEAGLRIDAAFDRPEYQPNENANVRLTLFDNAGQPVVGAFSVAMVNEAVYFAWPDQRDSARPLSYFSLQAETYPAKQAAAAQTREDRLQYVQAGWIGLGTLFVLVVYVFLWMKVRTLYVLILHGIAGFVLGCGGLIFLLTNLISDKPMAKLEAEPAGSRAAQKKMRTPAPRSEPGVGQPTATPPNVPVQPPAPAELAIETLLWRPIVITDETGRAELAVPLGPTVATWRFAAQAVTEDGRLGSVESKVRVTTQARSK